jgi:hypothetical protein
LCCFVFVFVWFVFVLCLVYQMLSVSLVCPFLIAPSVFSNVYLFGLSSSSVLCTKCCQFLWFVHSWLPLRFSLTFICLVCLRQVSCVPNVVSFSVCPFLIAPSVFSNVYLFGLSSSSVLCTKCCQFLWFVHSWLPLRFSLTFICLVCLRQVSCVPNVVSFSGLSILACPFKLF